MMQHFRAEDGAELAFAEAGSGDVTLLFVHGWRADHTVWRELTGALSPAMRTLTVDLRGSGGSRAAGGPYTLERYAADLRDLIEARTLGPVVMVGHSMGATIALRFAVTYPAATRGLVLIAPVPAGGAGFSPKGVAYLRAATEDPDATKSWLARTLVTQDDPALLERLCSAAATTTRDVALESFDPWAFADFAAETSSIVAPTLVIAPSLDGPEAAERRVAALLRDARYVVLPDSAHYAIVERPEAIAQLIRAFVAEL
jgi:pimeloyl-ACP methyl ester carboxylesterase